MTVFLSDYPVVLLYWGLRYSAIWFTIEFTSQSLQLDVLLFHCVLKVT